MKKGRIIILSGPSGAGKTTLYKKLLLDKRFKGLVIRSVSMTTRLPRRGERNGKDYFFVSRPAFLYKKKAGQLLESQKVYHDYYGTPLKPVLESLRRGKNVLLAIEVKGAKVVRKKVPGCLAIFIKTPSLAVLKQRLVTRATENPKDLRGRLARARMELGEAAAYPYVLVNDVLSRCYDELTNILQRELCAGPAVCCKAVRDS
jgi:guanylate kinase